MLDKLIGPVTGLLNKFIPDKDQANALAHEIATMSQKHAQENALAQIEVNTQEAKGNWFQSSWRPATAWACVLGLAGRRAWGWGQGLGQTQAKAPAPAPAQAQA